MTTNPTMPGAYVLGMHRSGTSLLAGVLDRLGLDAGRQELMFKADEFNSDGYWERVDIVEWHDRALRRQGGWASAPPHPMALADDRLAGLADEIPRLLTPYTKPWMLKDPRQCLMLPLWHEARGSTDLHVISVRHPHEIQRSLQRRNSYSPELGIALWERYVYDMLRASRGRPALLVSYEALTTKPEATIPVIADALAATVLRNQPPDDRAITSAISLVRPATAPEPPPAMGAERQHLFDTLMDRLGLQASLDFDAVAMSSDSRRVIDRRRRRLNLVGFAGRRGAVVRGRLDRLPVFR
ncbi:MAG: sulfotransferase [Actinomycetota bacterium]